MYTLTGRRHLPEEELHHLSVYEGSLPVRVGNATAGQFQLEVWGEVIDGLSTARDAGLATDEEACSLQCLLAEHLERVWREPDSPLWEVRGSRRHYVHSKVMAWVGFDRMIRTAERAGLPGLRRRPRDVHAVLRLPGPGRGAAPAAPAGVPAGRRRAGARHGRRGTARAVRERLRHALPRRQRRRGRARDLRRAARRRGAFLACSFWLADALALCGRREEAVELFERLLELRNDVGLLSEEWDPHAHRQLGNTPQAFSHVALMNTALALEQGAAHLPTSDEDRARTDPAR